MAVHAVPFQNLVSAKFVPLLIVTWSSNTLVSPAVVIAVLAVVSDHDDPVAKNSLDPLSPATPFVPFVPAYPTA